VIHRDLKPNNIIRRKRDQKLVLIDFGTAKVLQAGILEGEDRTIEIGTPGYMPIEQIAGYPRFNSDLFALGIIGIQAITGLLPRQLERDLKTCELIWHGQVSSELAAILNRMVLYNFMERYQSAAEVLADLEQIFTQPGPQPLLA
jgi:serine/threonine-protein kinase